MIFAPPTNCTFSNATQQLEGLGPPEVFQNDRRSSGTDVAKRHSIWFDSAYTRLFD